MPRPIPAPSRQQDLLLLLSGSGCLSLLRFDAALGRCATCGCCWLPLLSRPVQPGCSLLPRGVGATSNMPPLCALRPSRPAGWWRCSSWRCRQSCQVTRSGCWWCTREALRWQLPPAWAPCAWQCACPQRLLAAAAAAAMARCSALRPPWRCPGTCAAWRSLPMTATAGQRQHQHQQRQQQGPANSPGSALRRCTSTRGADMVRGCSMSLLSTAAAPLQPSQALGRASCGCARSCPSPPTALASLAPAWACRARWCRQRWARLPALRCWCCTSGACSCWAAAQLASMLTSRRCAGGARCPAKLQTPAAASLRHRQRLRQLESTQGGLSPWRSPTSPPLSSCQMPCPARAAMKRCRTRGSRRQRARRQRRGCP